MKRVAINISLLQLKVATNNDQDADTGDGEDQATSGQAKCCWAKSQGKTLAGMLCLGASLREDTDDDDDNILNRDCSGHLFL